MGVGISQITVLRDEQASKHWYSMSVTEDGMLMDVSDEQPSKHPAPKCVTHDGIVMDVSDEQPWKQKFPKLVTDDGIIVLRHPAIMVLVLVSMIAWQFSRESYAGLFASTRIDASEEQSIKQLPSKLVTVDGIVIEVSNEQPWKQKYPKLLTDDGIIVLRHPAIMVLVFVSMIALQLSRESYTGLFVSTRIEASEEQ